MFVDVVDDALFERQDIFFAVCLIRWRTKRELEYLAADEHFEECGLVEILAGFGFATLSHVSLSLNILRIASFAADGLQPP